MLVRVPDFKFRVLPVGIHDSTLREVEYVYSTNATRTLLFEGLVKGAKALSSAGCKNLYLNGSYVSSKRHPGDYDACWDTDGVNFEVLDPVLWDLTSGTGTQKEIYLGEFFPSTLVESESNLLFVDFFQSIADSKSKKGIVRIDTRNDPFLRSS